jgi:hypothetical protein
MHRRASEALKNTSGSRAWHPVQGTLMLLPAGTIDRRTAKHDSVGEVQRAYVALRAPPDENGACAGSLATTQMRLTAWVKTQRLAAS